MTNNPASRPPRRRVLHFPGTVLVVALACTLARAGNSVETTWLPTPPLRGLAPDLPAKVTLKLPYDQNGPVQQAILLVGRIPPPPAEQTSQPASRPNTTITIKLKSNGKQLPNWTIGKVPSAYIINLATINANPGFKNGELELETEVQRTKGLKRPAPSSGASSA